MNIWKIRKETKKKMVKIRELLGWIAAFATAIVSVIDQMMA